MWPIRNSVHRLHRVHHRHKREVIPAAEAGHPHRVRFLPEAEDENAAVAITIREKVSSFFPFLKNLNFFIFCLSASKEPKFENYEEWNIPMKNK